MLNPNAKVGSKVDHEVGDASSSGLTALIPRKGYFGVRIEIGNEILRPEKTSERICSSMPKTDADRRSPQSVLGIIRLRLVVLTLVNYQLTSWLHQRKTAIVTAYNET